MSQADLAPVPYRTPVQNSGLSTVVGLVQCLALLAVAIDGLFLQIGPVNINSERIVIAPVLVLLAYVGVVTRRLQITNATKFYFIWVVVVLFSTLLSYAPSKHINGMIISIVPFFYFFLFSERGFNYFNVGRMIEGWLWFMGVGSVATYAIWLVSGQLGFAVDGGGRIAFTMFEPNILGAVMASMMLAHFAYFRPILRHFVLHGLGLITLLLTASRFPYGAYAIGAFYYFVRSGLIRRPIVLFCFAVGMIGTVLVAGFLFDRIADAYSTHLDRIDTVNSRMVILGFAWERFLQHPILGNGPLDFGLTGYSILPMIGSTDIHDAWIWQIWGAILHDEGVVGLVFFVAFVVACWRRTERMIAQGYTYFLAFQCAALALLISSQGTTEHLTASWGVIFGLANSPPFLRRRAHPSKPMKPAAPPTEWLPAVARHSPFAGRP